MRPKDTDTDEVTTKDIWEAELRILEVNLSWLRTLDTSLIDGLSVLAIQAARRKFARAAEKAWRETRSACKPGGQNG